MCSKVAGLQLGPGTLYAAAAAPSAGVEISNQGCSTAQFFSHPEMPCKMEVLMGISTTIHLVLFFVNLSCVAWAWDNPTIPWTRRGFTMGGSHQDMLFFWIQ